MLFNKKEPVVDIDSKIIDNIKALNIDIINTKHNGNFDISLGLTKTLYTLYSKHLRIDPSNPNWLNRDRVILSSSSAYSLLLSILFMSGFNISLESLKIPNKSKDKIPGIDIISNNFSEGLAMASGVAIGERYIHECFKDNKLCDFYTYVICTDLDVIKGTSFESLTLAGTLKLNKLIIMFDNNKSVLAENENDIFTLDVVKYFESLNLNVIIVNKNKLEEIDSAITKAKSSDKPTVIVLNHDNDHDRFENNYIDNDYVLTEKEEKEVKDELGVRNIPFTVSSESRDSMIEMINSRMKDEIDNWNKTYESINYETKQELDKIINHDFTADTNINYQLDEEDTLDKICYKILDSLALNNTFSMIGTSNYDNSIINNFTNYKLFNKDNYLGRNINYSLRESATSSIQNGLALAGIRNYSITNLKTVNKLISSIRIACDYDLPNTYILIEESNSFIDGLDSNFTNELVTLRSIPNLEVFRPNDANELIGVFKLILAKKAGPSCIIINKKQVPIKENSSISDVEKGAYVIKPENKDIDAIILSSGSDLDIALDITNKLEEKGHDIRVVSIPSVNRYLDQDDTYRNSIIVKDRKVFVIENSSSYSWNGFVENDKYLITTDKVEWYKNSDEIDEFKQKVIEKIENLIQES